MLQFVILIDCFICRQQCDVFHNPPPADCEPDNFPGNYDGESLIPLGIFI